MTDVEHSRYEIGDVLRVEAFDYRFEFVICEAVNLIDVQQQTY